MEIYLDIQSGIDQGKLLQYQGRFSGGTIISGGSIIDDLIIQNVRNPQISGNTDTFVVQTATSTGSLIDVNESVSSVTLTPGAITSASIEHILRQQVRQHLCISILKSQTLFQ